MEPRIRNYYEHHKEPLAPRKTFLQRLLHSFIIASFIIMASLTAGILGYHYIEGIPWIDAYLEAALILSGMGPVAILHTTGGKIFAGIFALYSGCALLLTVGILLAPIVHRFLHKFHLEISDKN